MAERPRFPGTDHGPFGQPVRHQQPTPRIPASFGMGDFPGTRSNPFGADRPPVKKSSDSASARWGMADFPGARPNFFGGTSKLEKGVRVDPFEQDLLELTGTFEGVGPFQDVIGQIVNDWQGTARVRELLKFGANYHELGSVREALMKFEEKTEIRTVSVQGKHEVFQGDLMGIINRRAVGPKTFFDCVVITDEGPTLVTLRRVEDGLSYRFRTGFAPRQPHERTIEETVIPACKK